MVEFPGLHEKIRGHVLRKPDWIAVERGDERVSYRTLEERSNQIADVLRTAGEKEKNIPILLEQSIELVQAILGVVKAGCVFAPLDPGFPENRLLYMIDKVEADWVITRQLWLEKLDHLMEDSGRRIRALVMDARPAKAMVLPNIDLHYLDPALQRTAGPEVINKYCYIYFTSGSTGRPKAVLGRHRSLEQFIEWEVREFGLDENCRVSQLTSPSFDPFLRDLFVPLTVGGTLCIPEQRELILEPARLKSWLDEKAITHVHMVPTVFKALMNELHDPDCLPNLKYIFLAGEMLRGNDLKACFRCFGSRIQLVNLYGPTETTLAKMFYRISEGDQERVAIPVGKPIDGVQVMILQNGMQPCAVGSPGEIYIRTPFISSGYYKDRELTREVFLQNPFSDNPQDIIYKTGDIGRMLPCGNVEIVGRVDYQVKVRGSRVELGEIENLLLEVQGITEAVAVVRDDAGGETYLVAYVVADEHIEPATLRDRLAHELPDYMVPAFFVAMDTMPLTPNGKIDRKALPEPDKLRNAGVAYLPPQSEVEAKLLTIWREILKVEGVGVMHNFFEIGGHSLNAATVVAMIQKELQVKVSLKAIFAYPTIRELAKHLKQGEAISYASIQTLPLQDYYPVSSAQKRLYILHQRDGGSIQYNIPRVTRVEGAIDSVLLKQNMEALMERHEVLRTSFLMVNGEIVQSILPQVACDFLELEATDAEVDGIIRGFVRPFDLAQGPLFRVGLVKLAEEQHLLLLDLHHIISDGVSMGILLDEFVRLYQGEVLPPLPIQYKDFAAWQNQLFGSETMKEQEAYWLETFAGEIPVLNLPLDHPRPSVQSNRGETITFSIDPMITDRLEELAAGAGSTMYMVLLAGFSILLSKYSGQEDLVIGSPIAGRRHADVQHLIGVFINMLALRNRPVGTKSFDMFLKEVRENTLKAYDHQEYPFEEFVEKLQWQRNLSRNPVFDVMFSLQNALKEEIEIKDLRFAPYHREQAVAKYDLTLDALHREGAIVFSFEYCTDLFSQERIERIASHYVNILQAIGENPHQLLSKIEMLSPAEKTQILDTFNATHVNYDREKTLHEWIETKAEEIPEEVALVWEAETCTYGELNRKSNQLAHLLRNRAVQREEIVGIMAERSIEMIIAILGVLKAGGAYMPMDPDYPEERIEYMLTDSSCRILLTQPQYAARVHFQGQRITLAESTMETGNGERLEHCNQGVDLAYVMYTSGSTGKPKGVLLTHRGVVNVANSYQAMFALEKRRIVHMANVAFDGSIVEIFPPLMFGGTIHILRKEVALDRKRFLQYVRDHQIQIAQFVPMTLKELLAHDERPECLQTVLVAGDRLEEGLKDLILSRGYHLTNHYGPTEGTVDSVVARCEAGKTTIGKPIDNTRVYILGKDDQLAPIGVPGELCVGGDGLARGYLNQPEMTAEKFVSDPFRTGERIYRTGDLACWQSDGNITFLGRMDNQIKLRGYRVELGEIEWQIQQYPGITDAVVVDRVDSQGEKYLCAYLVADAPLTVSDLRVHLVQELPDYMIPARFVQLESLPLTASGKVDRKLLPEPEGGVIDQGIEPVTPTNPIEARLVEIWKEILHIDAIGIQHNFFDAGGHSLKATVLAAKIHQEWKVDLPLSEIFQNPVLQDLAAQIASTRESIYEAIPVVPQQDYYPASSAQKRLYIVCQYEDAGVNYNMPAALQLDGLLDKQQLENTFRQLIQRHETLRTGFEMIDGEIVQRVYRDVPLPIQYRTAEEAEMSSVMREFIHPFDLERAPLLRVQLVELAEKRHILLFDLHHIISDGWSMEILTREFVKLYQGLTLSVPRLQYKDYAVWQNQLFATDALIRSQQFWQKIFTETIPLLHLPTDFPRPAMQSFAGDHVDFELDAEMTEVLNRLIKETGITLHMFFLAAYNLLLAKYTGEDEIIIGTPVAGRPHMDLQGIIGLFVNILAMRNTVNGEISFTTFVQEVKSNALQAYEHQNLPFEHLLELLELPRDPSRNPLFDTVLVVHNTEEELAVMEGLTVTLYKLNHAVAKFDLTLHVQEVGSKIHCSLVYAKRLFKQETIQMMAEHWIWMIRQILTQPDLRLDEISLFSVEIKAHLLKEFRETSGQKELLRNEPTVATDRKIEAEFDF